MQRIYPTDAWELLGPILTPERKQRFLDCVSRRTDHIRLVLQDVDDPHNVTACMRSAEAMGILNVDIVGDNPEKRRRNLKRVRKSTASRGAKAWLDVHKYDSIKDCAETLKKAGYRLAAGFPPRSDVVSLEKLSLEEPLAIIFGNEHNGLDAAWDEYLDLKFSIPMYGMVESFNISVSAAITLHDTTQRARRLGRESFLISPEKQTSLLNKWVCSHFPNYEKHLEALRKGQP